MASALHDTDRAAETYSTSTRLDISADMALEAMARRMGTKKATLIRMILASWLDSVNDCKPRKHDVLELQKEHFRFTYNALANDGKFDAAEWAVIEWQRHQIEDAMWDARIPSTPNA